MAKKTTTTKKRVVKVDAYGQAHISSTFNNVIVSLANSEGQVISWSSAGKCGFRGSKKNTPYAAQMAAEDASKTAFDAGLRKVTVIPALLMVLMADSRPEPGPLTYTFTLRRPASNAVLEAQEDQGVWYPAQGEAESEVHVRCAGASVP